MTRPVAYRHLFNFAVSRTGGGLKRLFEYARWFDDHGGAWFVIHPQVEAILMRTFPRNRYFAVLQSQFERMYADGRYLKGVVHETGQPDLYYTNCIPIYARFGRVNWFHLTNVLPLHARGIPLSLFDRVRLGYLGWRIRSTYHQADVISAESAFSLGLIEDAQREKLFLSVLGSDDELAHLQDPGVTREEIATVVGTYRYKAIRDSWRVFEMLRRTRPELRLEIIGVPDSVPADVRSKRGVVITGVLPREEVVERLRRSRFYISTTLIEGAYNAASEGVFLAEEAYISDIGPHQELLENVPHDRMTVPGMDRSILRVRSAGSPPAHLKSWDQVITDMLAEATERLAANA